MAFLTAEQKKEQGLIHASPLRQRMMLWSAFQQPHINAIVVWRAEKSLPTKPEPESISDTVNEVIAREPREIFVVQLREVRTEWQRRNPEVPPSVSLGGTEGRPSGSKA